MKKLIPLMAIIAIVSLLTCTIAVTDVSTAEGQTDAEAPATTGTSNPTSTQELKDVITAAADNDTITLGGSFEITEQIDVDKPLTINLNGNILTITTENPAGFFFTATSTIENGYINDFRNGTTIRDANGNDVSNNGWRVIIASGSDVTLTISDVEIFQDNPVASTEDVTRYNYAVRGNDGASITLLDGTRVSSPETAVTGSDGTVGVAMVGKNGGGYTSKLTVEQGVTITTYAYAITGNGISTLGNVDFDINGGTIISYASHAIYQPQIGDMTIDGDATIDGVTGIEIRAGTLTVNSGNVTGSTAETVCNPNSSGITTIGAGIAVVQHTTERTIEVTINGGFIKGNTALYENNVQNNPESSVKGITLSIAGGTFNIDETSLKSLDIIDYDTITLNITGGQYSAEFPEVYLGIDYSLMQNSLGMFQVYSSDELVTITFDLGMDPNPTQTIPWGETFDESALPLSPAPVGTSYIWFDSNKYPYNSDSAITESVTISPAFISDTMIDVSIGIEFRDGKAILVAHLNDYSDYIPFYTFWGQEYDEAPIPGTTQYEITESGTYLFTTMVLGSDGIYHMGFNSYTATVQTEVPSAGETVQVDGDLAVIPTENGNVDLNLDFNNVQSTPGETTNTVQIAITGSVENQGNVAVSVKPVSTLPEQINTETMAAVDVTVTNVAAGYTMTIALDVSDLITDGQFLAGATVYYWEDENSTPIEIDPSNYTIDGNTIHITTHSNTCYGAVVQTTTENPDQTVIPPFPWDDNDEYVPPIVPVQPDQSSGDDDTTTIVACAAAAVVAALMATFLIIERRR